MPRITLALATMLFFMVLTPVAAQEQSEPYWATAWRDNGFQAFNCYERERNGKGLGRPNTIYLNETEKLVGTDWLTSDKVKAYDIGFDGALTSIVWEGKSEPRAHGQTWFFYYFSRADLTLQIIGLEYRVSKSRDYEVLGLTAVDDRSWSNYPFCEPL